MLLLVPVSHSETVREFGLKPAGTPRNITNPDLQAAFGLPQNEVGKTVKSLLAEARIPHEIVPG
jgi:hypothetical protein